MLKQKHLKEANCGTINDKIIIDAKLLLVHTSNNIYRWFSCIVIVKICFLSIVLNSLYTCFSMKVMAWTCVDLVES